MSALSSFSEDGGGTNQIGERLPKDRISLSIVPGERGAACISMT